MAFPGIIAGFVIGFVLFIGNLGTSLLVVAPGRATLPITIYNYMHYGAEETVFALSLILILFILLPLLLLLFGYRKLNFKVNSELSGRAYLL